jgi:hypothetical protein
MKKVMILFLSLFLVQALVKADNDKPIEFNQLPQSSQQFVKKHFASKAIALIKMDSDFFDRSYEVIFSNGDKVDFDKKGNWKDVDCRYSELPEIIVPIQIRNYVAKNYPGVKVLKVEKEDRGKLEVGLSNNLDLTFDSKFNLVDIDN